MQSEAEGALIQRGAYITQKTDLDLMRFARERGLVKESRSLNIESGRIIVLKTPNVSEAIRVALEEFFAGRELV